MSEIPTDVVAPWQAYNGDFAQIFGQPKFIPDNTPENTRSWFELKFNGRTFKYSVKVHGATRPAGGFPLYIGLHGGGSDTLRKNDGYWGGMIVSEYGVSVPKFMTQAVYVAVRGVSSVAPDGTLFDEYNLHWQPESFVLMQRMIRGLLLSMPYEVSCLGVATPFKTPGYEKTTFVNPNLVYLLGFSAGGDGAFRMAATIPDIFGAVNTGGGHPNGVKFTNILNLALSIQCGEKDSNDFLEDKSGVHNRARELALVNESIDTLERNTPTELATQLPDALQNAVSRNIVKPYRFYRHKYYIVKGVGHHKWSIPSQLGTEQTIFKNPTAWREKFDNPTDPSKNTLQAQETATMDINAVRLVSGFTREPLPAFVVWDLSTRPERPWSAVDSAREKETGLHGIWCPKSVFYWLFIRTPHNMWIGDTVKAAYDLASNSIWVDQPRDYLGLLLNDRMVDLNKEISVYVGKTLLKKVTATRSSKLMAQTLQATGDPWRVFSVMVQFVVSGGNWDAVAVDDLGWVPGPRHDQVAPLRANL